MEPTIFSFEVHCDDGEQPFVRMFDGPPKELEDQGFHLGDLDEADPKVCVVLAALLDLWYTQPEACERLAHYGIHLTADFADPNLKAKET